jgi:hypothetical protein
MERLIYIIALILVVIWIVGFFFYSLGALIHAVLLLALVILVFRIFVRRRTPKDRVR